MARAHEEVAPCREVVSSPQDMPSSGVDIARLIDSRRLSSFQIRVFVLIGCLVLLDGFDVQAIGFVAPALVRAWHLEPQVLGPVFSAGLLGMLAGAMSWSLVADRIGRRPVLIACTFFFAACMLATAMAQSVTQLAALRFLTGFGIGGVMANAVTLASEYCPATRRASLLMVISCGFTAGAILGGVITAVLLPRAGWPAVFVVGGLLPLVLAPILLRELPESLYFLASTSNRAKLNYWLARLRLQTQIVPPNIQRDQPDAAAAALGSDSPRAKISVVELLREGRGKISLLLWCVSFANLLNLYFLSSWLPLLASRMGYSDRLSVLVGVTLQLGGIAGALVLGPLIDRRGFYRVLAPAFALGAVVIATIGRPSLPLTILFGAVFLAGVCVVGGQPGINALAASLYPTRLRATGVGWCLGIGRAGSITGPIVAAQLIARDLGPETLFLFAAVPAVLSFMTMWGMSLVSAGKVANRAV
jgi:AAHS family 4-hydroxybenzoate transporter-like MFS transporter